MAKLNTLKESSTHRIIVYGAPKTGKSELVGKLAEFYDLIWVDLENGHSVLHKLPETWKQRIEIVNIRDTKSYPIAAETCLKMVKGPVSICEVHSKVGCMICTREEVKVCKDAPKEEHGDIHASFFIDLDIPEMGPEKIVVFDSLTQLSNSIISHITKKQPDDYKLNYDDWGNLAKLLDVFLSEIQQAGYNVIVISHEQEIEGENKKKSLTPVGGTRNYSRNVAKFFDHVVYCERKNKKHVFASSTTYATNILTGSRSDVKIEDGGDDASLLAIFKPELYAQRIAASSGAPSVTATKTGSSVSKSPVKASTAAILAKLKNQKKK
ncbi:MAG: hypothetical protein COB66_01370 [Coxiella sp. (in: Bacteria)]|nr:MAG: hypothetical protein COB66_01370 [Coxiella sp. (in: g-proteobacteria)]